MLSAKEIKGTYMVFRNGKWIQYDTNFEENSEVTEKMKWELASAYGTAKAKGFSEDRAKVLAEMYVFKKKFSDLAYSSELEAEYRKLFF